MSYQDKQIAKIEEQNEEIMLLEGLKLTLKRKLEKLDDENKKLEIELDKAITKIKLKVKDNIPFNEEELSPNLKFILNDLLQNPNTLRFRFFMDYCNAGNILEVIKAFKILVSCKSEEETILNNPLFKDFVKMAGLASLEN